jgi:CheY-like chemotaxis protein
MVELHGGTVSAESAGVNRGATFRVTFPVRAVVDTPALPQPPVGAQQKTGPAHVSLAGIRVLVVDDEPDARELVAAILTEYGADVRVAPSAHDAYGEVQSWRPDVLVADIGMPDEDGYSLLRRVRALPADEGGAIPAAALTAYAQAEDRERAFAAGFQEHVAKPVLAQELARLVASLAGMKNPRMS